MVYAALRIPGFILSISNEFERLHAGWESRSRDNEDSERAGAARRFIFTRDEREMVRTLVVRHRDIVESKVSSNFANKLKDDAWERITREYNAQEGVRPVTVTQIRKMWDNEKTRFKKRQAEATRDRYATGNKSPTGRPVSPGLAQVGAAATHIATQVADRNDSDGAFLGEAVLALPPAAVFEAMVPDGQVSLNVRAPSAPTGTATPLPGPSPWHDSFLPPVAHTISSAAVRPPTPTGPPAVQADAAMVAITEPFPARAARLSAAENRTAAVERVLREEAEARIRGIEKDQERQQELHALELTRRKRQMRHEQWKQGLERKTVRLELKIKQQQLAGLNNHLAD